jgi:hypothetical protein
MAYKNILLFLVVVLAGSTVGQRDEPARQNPPQDPETSVFQEHLQILRMALETALQKMSEELKR